MIFDFLRKKKPEGESGDNESTQVEASNPLVEEPAFEIPDNLKAAPAEADMVAEPVPVSAPSVEEKLSAEEAPEAAFDPAAELAAAPAPAAAEEESAPPQPVTQEKPQKEGFFARIRRGLSRTSSQFAEGMGNLFLGAKEIDEDLMEELETQLLMADVGVDATTEIIDRLTERVSRRELSNGEALYKALQEELASLLDKVEAPLAIDMAKQPFVILVVGVNGVGKTTTIGKLAHRYLNEGKSVMLAAGDTFRAAAVEQLQVWGQRHDVPVVAQHTGADSASVIFDAIQSAKSRGVDVVIADTAGRLHNKAHLMEELSKVRRVMGKLDESAPHEVLLVLDAGTGQNAISQAETFKSATGVTGLVLTKLDGTAKGGVIFALAQKLGIPVRFIGVGEQSEDLQPFVAKDFVAALFNKNQA
ncbi:signal recognition particle-docking protein FtsY [Microbulbifer sp. SH-1]|uniref:signal recognition particle-docking protein FtsY n=1 Tax=Microbulbifer sp. SH-1 TaxID=2681547 RepID=UPI00140C6D39|nr:signal recognition particle-docking protein FtsY [Microbulbifer sp. SH-1]QIL90828.1 signal recognition particle-docking protein FtsY [Microbulbifer sp. SH-1]